MSQDLSYFSAKPCYFSLNLPWSSSVMFPIAVLRAGSVISDSYDSQKLQSKP